MGEIVFSLIKIEKKWSYVKSGNSRKPVSAKK